MNELSLFNDEEKKMTTKELAEVLGVDVRTVNGTVERLLESTSQKLGEIKTISNGGRPTKVFTEEQASIIKSEIAKHHNLASRQIDEVSSDYEMEMLTLKVIKHHIGKANEYKARAEKAEQTLLEEKENIEFAHLVTDCKDFMPIAEAAKILNCNMGQNKLYEWLRENSYIIPCSTLPYQKYIELGYFRVIENKYIDRKNGETKIYPKTLISNKGLKAISKKICRGN